jgi:mono/diheme cytochrome c family protein
MLAALGLALAFAAGGYFVAPAAGRIGDGTTLTQPTGTGGAAPADNSDTGKELFVTWGCGNCHVLADAGAAGQVGPSLDGSPYLTDALVVNRITYGQGGMPAFGGQLSEEDIAAIAAYIIRVAVK